MKTFEEILVEFEERLENSYAIKASLRCAIEQAFENSGLSVGEAKTTGTYHRGYYDALCDIRNRQKEFLDGK